MYAKFFSILKATCIQKKKARQKEPDRKIIGVVKCLLLKIL